MMRKAASSIFEGDGGAALKPLEIVIDLACDGWRDAIPTAEELSRRAAQAALAGISAPCGGELSLVLADDATVRALNRDWRHIDAPTNVLSFPGAVPDDSDGPVPNGIPVNDAPPLLLGDVIVALETTQAEALRDGKALADHLSHLIVHGTLHLRGYDHENDADAEEMEALETTILKGLGIVDPYDGMPADGDRLTGVGDDG